MKVSLIAYIQIAYIVISFLSTIVDALRKEEEAAFWRQLDAGLE